MCLHEMFQRMLGSSDSEKKKPGSCQMLCLTTGLFTNGQDGIQYCYIQATYEWGMSALPSREGGPGFTRGMSKVSRVGGRNAQTHVW